MKTSHNEAGLDGTQAHSNGTQNAESGAAIVSEAGGSVNTFLGAALDYAALGFRVFPVAERGKEPQIAGGHGCKDATTDEAVIID